MVFTSSSTLNVNTEHVIRYLDLKVRQRLEKIKPQWCRIFSPSEYIQLCEWTFTWPHFQTRWQKMSSVDIWYLLIWYAMIARGARNKNMTVASLMPEVDKVVTCYDKARFTHNASKCETAFLSLDCVDAAWQHIITIDAKQMFCNPLPDFLGARCDRQLTYAEHVRKLCQPISGYDIWPFQPPLCYGRHDLGMAHFGLTSGQHRDFA